MDTAPLCLSIRNFMLSCGSCCPVNALALHERSWLQLCMRLSARCKWSMAHRLPAPLAFKLTPLLVLWSPLLLVELTGRDPALRVSPPADSAPWAENSMDRGSAQLCAHIQSYRGGWRRLWARRAPLAYLPANARAAFSSFAGDLERRLWYLSQREAREFMCRRLRRWVAQLAVPACRFRLSGIFCLLPVALCATSALSI